MSHRTAAVISMMSCLALAAGCAVRERKERPEARTPTASHDTTRAASSPPSFEEPPAFTRNYMIYSVHHGRAADLAATLEPVLKARYGPEARVVAHVPSNKLFIYIPPDDPSRRTDTSRRRAARPPRAR